MYSSKNKTALHNTFSSMLRNKEDLSIGVEIENIIYDKDFQRIPANVGPAFSSPHLSKKLEVKNSEAGINPLLTIEPGGQIEYASQPYNQLKTLDEELRKYIKNLLLVAEEKNLIVSDLAIEPFLQTDKIKIIKQDKYKLMYKYFKNTGTLGHEMMLNSASIQINLDYTSLEEAGKMAFVADCLHPIISVIFANTPFFQGKPSGNRNLREIVWRNTDPARSNCLLDHNIANKKTLVEDFGDYVLDSPAIFIYREGGIIESFQGTLGSWLGAISSHRNIEKADVMIALRQIFTQVRFKHVLEIRGPDRLPFGYELAPAAFFQGIFRSPTIFDDTLKICQSWPIAKRHLLNSAASTLDFEQSIFEGENLKDLCEKFLLLAIDGLTNLGEDSFLEPFANQFLKEGPFSLSIQELFHQSGKGLKQFMSDRWSAQKELLLDHSKK